MNNPVKADPSDEAPGIPLQRRRHSAPSALINAGLHGAALAVVTVGVLIWRRPGQFLHPYVWVEEGTVTLPAYLHHGWLSVFSPVAGYLVIPSKLIFLLSASLSFTHLPELTYWLTLLFTFLVVLSVARCPTYLRWPTVCAIAMLLIPSNPEVFAVSEYAFWWGTVLLFVSLLWRQDARRTPLRVFLTALGGLSSPLVIPLTGLFAVRAWRFRTRHEYVTLATVAIAAAVQTTCLLITHDISHDANHGFSANFDPLLVVAKFFGYFVFWSAHSHVGQGRSVVIGIIVILALLGILARRPRNAGWGSVLLGAMLVIAIASSIVRVPVSIMHPVLAGPRYFFFPYILLAWLLIQAASMGAAWEKLIVTLLLVAALHQTALYGRRHSDPINWRQQLAACSSSAAPYALPIQFDGSRDTLWHVTLTATQCRALQSRSMFQGHAEAKVM